MHKDKEAFDKGRESLHKDKEAFDKRKRKPCIRIRKVMISGRESLAKG